jgi:outer membrane protein assembly factor BamB
LLQATLLIAAADPPDGGRVTLQASGYFLNRLASGDSEDDAGMLDLEPAQTTLTGHGLQNRQISWSNGQGARFTSTHGFPSTAGAVFLLQHTRPRNFLHDLWPGPLGTLSTDGVRVYAVDDLAVPPYRRSPRGRWRQEFSWPDFGPELTDAANSSRLLALDAERGKLLWEIGGRGGTSRAGGLSDSYFLGPPLPLDGRLYALTEKDNKLALVCVAAADGALVWKQALAYAPTRLLLDPGRRVQAARPAYGEGILVCPTNAGMVVGVDLLTPGLAWAYSYRTRPLTQSQPSSVGRRVKVSPTQITAEWQAPVTVVQGGKIIFTAPDCPSIHCLRLRDGSPLWEAARANDDLYVAGIFAGKGLCCKSPDSGTLGKPGNYPALPTCLFEEFCNKALRPSEPLHQ